MRLFVSSTISLITFIILTQVITAYQPDLRIVPKMAPFYALVRGKTYPWDISKPMSNCGGVLISENYVLTLASCVNGSRIKAEVYLGYHKYQWKFRQSYTHKAQSFLANTFIVHESFRKIRKDKFCNNIALIKLPTPVVLSKTVEPAVLLSKEKRQTLEDEVVADLISWGYPGSHLVSARTILKTQDFCSSAFEDLIREQEGCIYWTDDPNKMSRPGSPISLDGKILGFQTTPSKDIFESRYSRILYIGPYLDWIAEKTNINKLVLTGYWGYYSGCT